MMEEFVTYDIALKLKGKGFKEGSDFIDLPTVSQVLKWLRKEKKLYVFIDLCQHNIYKELWWIYSVRDLKDDSTYILPEGCEKCRFYEGAALAGIRFVLDNLI